MLLNFLRWIKENSDISFEIFLKSTGELKGYFARLAPTNVFLQAQRNTFFSKLNFLWVGGRLDNEEYYGISHAQKMLERHDISVAAPQLVKVIDQFLGY